MILNTCIACEALERLIDPITNKTIALYGWLEEGRGLPRKYWVAIKDDSPQFFREESLAKYFYDESIKLMLASVCQTCTNGQIRRNGHHKQGYSAVQAVLKRSF